MIATPMAPPSWRVKFTSPVAVPICGCSTEFCAASAVDMNTKPMPKPSGTR